MPIIGIVVTLAIFALAKPFQAADGSRPTSTINTTYLLGDYLNRTCGTLRVSETSLRLNNSEIDFEYVKLKSDFYVIAKKPIQIVETESECRIEAAGGTKAFEVIGSDAIMLLDENGKRVFFVNEKLK